MLIVASLILATMLQAPMPAQQSSDVVPQARGILAAVVAGDFATVEKQFTDDMKAALPPGALAAMWGKLLNQAGAYKSCSADPRVRRIDNKDTIRRQRRHAERADADPDVTLRSYPALNRLFIAGTGVSLPAEYQVPGHVAEEVIRDVATWITTSR